MAKKLLKTEMRGKFMSSIDYVNFIIQSVAEGEWPKVTEGVFVPGAFSSKAESKSLDWKGTRSK